MQLLLALIAPWQYHQLKVGHVPVGQASNLCQGTSAQA